MEERYRIKDACGRWHYGANLWGYNDGHAMNYSSVQTAQYDGDQFSTFYLVYIQKGYDWIVENADAMVGKIKLIPEGGVLLDKEETFQLALVLSNTNVRNHYAKTAKRKIMFEAAVHGRVEEEDAQN